MTELFDITIIGAGPAGLYSAFYSGLREMKTKIIEAHPYLGGKMNVYQDKIVWDIGGVAPKPARLIMEDLIQQAQVFHPTVVKNQQIMTITKEDDQFILQAKSGEKHYTKTILLATGYGIVTPKKLILKAGKPIEAKNVYYHVKAMQDWQRKRLVISGGSDSALEWALFLQELGAQVTLVYRKSQSELKAHEATITKLIKNQIECYFETEIEDISMDAEGDFVKIVHLVNRKTNEKHNVEVEGLVVSHGFESKNPLLQQGVLGIELMDEYYVAATSKGEANVPGIFVAGDLAQYQGKVHLLAGVFQDAINAVNAAKKYVSPKAHERGYVSSHNQLFEEKNKKIKKDYQIE